MIKDDVPPADRALSPSVRPIDADPAAFARSSDPHVPPPRGRAASARDTVFAAVGVIMGLVPHVLHHIGLVAGAALTAGAGGNALFFAVGLIFSVPMLRRLYRRFHSWVAPAIAIAVFAALFSVSAFVLGPAISGSPAQTQPPPTVPSSTATTDGHAGHHAP